MLIPQRLNSRTFITLAIITAVAVGLIVYLLATYFWGSSTVPVGSVSPPIVSVTPIETTFANEMIGREPYTKLQEHGELPVSVGTVGRDNPFVPSSNLPLAVAPAATTTPIDSFLFNF